MSEPFWVFATGSRIDSGEIAGVVRHPWTGKPVANVAVVLHPEGAQDSAVFNPPTYGSRSDKDGRFVHTGYLRSTIRTATCAWARGRKAL